MLESETPHSVIIARGAAFMALNDREYISEKYRQRESIKRQQPFAKEAPPKPLSITVPTSTVGMAAAAILFGCGITVVVLSVIVFIGQ